jgi:phage shock protein A
LIKSKNALTGIIAKRKLADKKVAGIKESIAEYEGYAMKALDQADETLAGEVATKIADLEAELANEENLAKAFSDSEANLRKAVAGADGNIKRLKQQVDTVKATESVQKAQAAVAARYTGANSSMRSAVDSLERLKAKQVERSARFEAAAELAEAPADSDLEARLKSAGIKPSQSSGGDVLARLKAKKGG